MDSELVSIFRSQLSGARRRNALLLSSKRPMRLLKQKALDHCVIGSNSNAVHASTSATYSVLDVISQKTGSISAVD